VVGWFASDGKVVSTVHQRRRDGFKSEGAYLFLREAPENFLKSAPPPLLGCAAPVGGGTTKYTHLIYSLARRGHGRAEYHATWGIRDALIGRLQTAPRNVATSEAGSWSFVIDLN